MLPYRWVALTVAALAVLGMGREAFFHLLAEPIGQLPAVVHAPRSDERYLELRKLLPLGARLGYLSDELIDTEPGPVAHEPGTKLYQQALYALAPVVLLYGDDRAPLVLANLSNAGALEALARAHGLRVVKEFSPTLALLEPR